MEEKQKDDNTPELSPLYSVVLTLDEMIRGVAYNFTPDEDFLKVDSIAEMQIIYWGEMMQRVHICAATSIKRVKKWYDATQTAYVSKNYYAFCAALRGLIEACGDTFYTVSKIAEPLCTQFATIEVALNGHASSVLLSEPIEDELIHYMFAQKLSSAERATSPASHSAKQVRTYMDAIDDSAVTDLYAELCQVSHPSKVSLVPFLLSTENCSLMLHEAHVDDVLNDQLLDRHKPAILSASNLAVLPAICLLKLINEFNAPLLEALRTDDTALSPANDTPLWKSMFEWIQKSKQDAKA